MGNTFGGSKAEIRMLNKLVHESSGAQKRASAADPYTKASSVSEPLPTLLSSHRHVARQRELEKIRYDEKSMTYWRRGDAQTRRQLSNEDVEAYTKMNEWLTRFNGTPEAKIAFEKKTPTIRQIK
eukprot:gnl/MRDRNA2_/MRDRNA2_77912_c1_seq1.p2 gnl/MRDRNA2_/MRDRNA2_77912_c1~~gnl/MRDRNA2_/MRDRNA2_77912_c1_seq1.p2  ORF type:complete len:125 (+),score=20.56 gnl/MRDRNA2_/MRDRNA2_77912_c1_seq1:89-463(+)